jgi:signal transduction histidine kinase
VASMPGPPPEPSGPLPAAAQRVLDAVGFAFLTRGGAASISGVDGRLLWANAVWFDLVGRLEPSLDERAAALPWNLDELIGQWADSGGPVQREDTVRTANGLEQLLSEHWLALSATGEPLGFATAVAETTLAARSRRQVGALQERLDDLTRLVSDWVWEVATDLSLSFVSARVTELLGCHPRELIGKELTELGQFVDSAGELAPNPLVLPRPRPFRDVRFVMFHADGGPLNFKLSALPVFDRDTGQFRGYRGTAHDVSPEARALDLAAKSRDELSEAIEAIPDGFALFAKDETLLISNRKFREILAATLSGDADQSLISGPAGRARKLDAFEYELSDGRWIRAVDRFMPDGRIVDLRTDITELKHREQALMIARAVAELANRAKSEFLANISHELRTPLNAVIGFSELILTEPKGPLGHPSYTDYLGDVLTSGHRLLSLIEDIIDLAKAETGGLKLAEEVIEIPQVIELVMRQMRERAMVGRLAVAVKAAPDLPPLRADLSKLRQILTNLLSNAIKFTPAGGNVTVIARRDSAGDFIIEVIDTGIGIPAKDIAAAFKPFGQVDAGLSRVYEGTGLGLPLSRIMVELHGGRLTLESESGRGTTARICLPADRAVV